MPSSRSTVIFPFSRLCRAFPSPLSRCVRHRTASRICGSSSPSCSQHCPSPSGVRSRGSAPNNALERTRFARRSARALDLMITPEDIREAEARTNFLHERIDEAFAVRDRSDDHWRHWENACSEFHAYKPTLFQMGEPAVLNDITAAPGPWRRAGPLSLELDPWCF